jgi:hypothetical protein
MARYVSNGFEAGKIHPLQGAFEGVGPTLPQRYSPSLQNNLQINSAI